MQKLQRQENATAEVEQIQSPEAAPEQSDLEVEVEVSNESAQPLGRGPLFSFVPVNPENSNITEEQNENEENGPAYIFPLTNNPRRQENRNQTDSTKPCQLNVFDIPTEFPLIGNSLEDRRTNRYLYDLHRELAPFGFVLKEGDIVSSSPLDNQARSSSKIPIVIGYKDPQTRQDVVQAARKANLWNSRVPKKDDKKKDRRGFFHHHHITRRHIKNKREEKQPKPTTRRQPQPKPKLRRKIKTAPAKKRTRPARPERTTM